MSLTPCRTCRRRYVNPDGDCDECRRRIAYGQIVVAIGPCNVGAPVSPAFPELEQLRQLQLDGLDGLATLMIERHRTLRAHRRDQFEAQREIQAAGRYGYAQGRDEARHAD